MKIAMLYLNNPPFDLTTHDKFGIGGSESGFINTAKWLARLGHEVFVYNQLDTSEIIFSESPGQVHWQFIDRYNPNEYYDVVYSLRHFEPFTRWHHNTKLKVLFLADTESHGLGDVVRDGKVDLVMAVSRWQKEKIAAEEGIPDNYWLTTSNGVYIVDHVMPGPKVPGRCLFMATPERGLDNLLTLWPRIKKFVPFATLHVYSSFMGWRMSEAQNDETLRDLYIQMAGIEGVVNKKHGNAGEISKAQQEAWLYLYPSFYYETCCMNILESMWWSTPAVATSRAAVADKVLKTTGYPITDTGAFTQEYQDEFVAKAVGALLRTDPTDMEFNYIKQNAHMHAKQFTYDRLVPQWVAEWQKRMQ